MDELCSRVCDSNKCLDVYSSKGLRVSQNLRVPSHDTRRVRNQDDLTCSQSFGQNQCRGVTSASSEGADSAVAGPSDESSNDRNNSLVEKWCHVALYAVSAG